MRSKHLTANPVTLTQAPTCWQCVCQAIKWSWKLLPGLPFWAQTNSGASQVTEFPRSFAAGSQAPESKAVTCLGTSLLEKAASGSSLPPVQPHRWRSTNARTGFTGPRQAFLNHSQQMHVTAPAVHACVDMSSSVREVARRGDSSLSPGCWGG